MWHAHMATVDVAVGRDSVWDLGRAVECRGLTTRCVAVAVDALDLIASTGRS
jgi:hypothetical protein